MIKYTKEILEPIVKESLTMSEVGRKVGIKPHGGGQAHLKKRILEMGISISHFKNQGWSRDKITYNKKKAKDIFRVLPEGSNRTQAHQLRRALNEVGIETECINCKIKTWMNKKITLEVDHIDGNYLNNLQENLRLLCPNCHSQTSNYRNKKED
jgi:Zn finger protein HypA/HybF involved in hydrogenase expression